MAYVFGDTFICADKQSAQIVTFNRDIGVKSVTLEGDVYDPSGTLSGGAAPSSSGLLVKVQELRSIEREIAEHRKVVDEVTRELQGAKAVIDGFRKDKRELDLREHEVRLLEEQVNGSNATKVSERFRHIACNGYHGFEQGPKTEVAVSAVAIRARLPGF
jgi:structural maintenance of chromosome 2